MTDWRLTESLYNKASSTDKELLLLVSSISLLLHFPTFAQLKELFIVRRRTTSTFCCARVIMKRMTGVDKSSSKQQCANSRRA